jgi:WD40 repeat protein
MAGLAATVAAMAVGLVLLGRAWETADRHRQAAEQREADLRVRAYAADMGRAHDFWLRGATDEMAALLAGYEPRPGADDLRGFEWHYLRRLADARPRHVRTFPAVGVVYAAVFSPDGRHVAVTGEQSAIDVWDARTGERYARLEGHVDDCNSLAFTPDGKLLVSCGDDKTVCLWDMAGRKRVARLEGHTHVVQKVAVSPDGRLIASAGHDGHVRFWDVATRHAAGGLFHDEQDLRTVAFTRDGTAVASCASAGNTLGVRDIQSRSPRVTLEHSSAGVLHCAYSRDGALLAAATRAAVMVWDAHTGRLRHILGPTGTCYRFVTFDADGRWVLACGDDGRVRAWSLIDGALLGQFAIHPHLVYPQRAAWAVAISPDGRWLLTASGDQRADLWEMPDRWPRHEQRVVEPASPAAIAPDLPAVAFHDVSDLTLRVADLRRPDRASGVAATSTRPVIQFSADGRWLAYWTTPPADERRPPAVWDVDNARPAGEAPARPPPATDFGPGGMSNWTPFALAFCRGGQSLLAVYPDDALVEWDRSAGTVTRHDGVPDGVPHLLASAAAAPTVVVTSNGAWRPWDAGRRAWSGPGGRLAFAIIQAAVSADGRLLAAADTEGTIRLIELATGQVLTTIVGQRTLIGDGGLAFSPDGRTIATGVPGAVRLWQVATGLELFDLDHAPPDLAASRSPQFAVRFRTDGRALVAAGPQGNNTRVIVWEAGRDAGR